MHTYSVVIIGPKFGVAKDDIVLFTAADFEAAQRFVQQLSNEQGVAA